MKVEIIPALKNATIVLPEPVLDGSGKAHYYLDPDHATIELRANPGFIFDTRGSLSYSNGGLPDKLSLPPSYTDIAKKTVPSSISWYSQDTFGLTMEASPVQVKQYELKPTLQNAEIIDPKPVADSYGQTHYYLDQNHTTITIKANDGYTFENDGSLTYNNGGFDASMPIQANHTNTVTVSLPSNIDWSSQDTLALTMDAVAKPVPKYDLIPALQNAEIVDPQPVVDSTGKTHYYLDQQHTTITLKANDGFTFENDGSLTYASGGFDANMTIKATNTNTVTVSLPSNIDWSSQDTFSLTMAATVKPAPKYDLRPTLQNAEIVDPKPVVDSAGKTHYYLDQNHTTITIKANDGYTFENDGSLTYQGGGGFPTTIAVKASHTNTLTVSLPSTIDWSSQSDIDLTVGAVKAEIIKNTGGFTNIYKADYTNLLKFSNEVLVKMNGSNQQVYDVKPYISNLVMIPFNVPSGENSAIVAGNTAFTTQLPTVENNYLTVDLGNIIVNGQYQNGYDYYQVKTRLVLPYTDQVDLDPKHVINKTVSIKYAVNVINGDTTINLYNGDDLFFSKQVNLASEIPFISKDNNGSQYVVINQLKTMFRNAVQQAYIIIEQPTPVLNLDYYPTDEKGMLKDYTGNVKASLLFNMNINSNDLNALQNLLETGVQIK